jgi:hypothetical protein
MLNFQGATSIMYLLTFSKCYNAGDVHSSAKAQQTYADAYAGGILGLVKTSNPSGSVNHCVVLANEIIAEAYNAYCRNISYSSAKSNNLALDVIEGNATDDTGDGAGGTRITRSRAMQWTTYENLGWDFDTVWQIRPGYDFPQLRGPGPDGEVAFEPPVGRPAEDYGAIDITIGASFDVNKFFYDDKASGSWSCPGGIAEASTEGVLLGIRTGRTSLHFVSSDPKYADGTFDVVVCAPEKRNAFISDAHVGSVKRAGMETELADAINRADAMDADEIYLLGDNTNDGNADQYTAILAAMTVHSVDTSKLRWLMGNHDYGSDIYLNGAEPDEKYERFNASSGYATDIPNRLVYGSKANLPVKTAIVTINPSKQFNNAQDAESPVRFAGYSEEAYEQLADELTDLKIEGYEKIVLASHYPLEELERNSPLPSGENQKDVMAGLMRDYGAVMIYGHVHGRQTGAFDPANRRGRRLRRVFGTRVP